jgi:tryptophan-rich sensory protein
VAICFGAAAVGATSGPNGWYDSLEKPSITPPDWLFGPVWMVLYSLMAVSAFLVWKKHGLKGAGIALLLFAVQLALNACWSHLFFGMKRPDLAFYEIVIL